MYIASQYQNFITWQNTFLDQIIEPNKEGGILHHFVINMEKKIDVQNAKRNEVLNFDEVNKIFMEIIFENSKRDIFTEDNKINYSNYKQFIYDFDSIERILGEKILPGKVKLNGNLKFVTYCFEGFRENKSSVFTDFSRKYNSIPLIKEKKQKIYDTIKDKIEKIESKSDDLQRILFSMQLFIYYLTQERKEEKDEIKKIIEQLPDYVNLSQECKDFFDKQELKLEELNEVYSYIELLCFKPIILNLRKHYKKTLDTKKADNINKLFEDKKFKIINRINLSSACRKFISRYLVSFRDDTGYDENQKLTVYLNREELWNKEIWENEKILNEDLELLSKYELTISQCYELYNLLERDENNTLEGINLNKNEDIEIIKENANEQGKPKILKKKRKFNY